MMHADLS